MMRKNKLLIEIYNFDEGAQILETKRPDVDLVVPHTVQDAVDEFALVIWIFHRL